MMPAARWRACEKMDAKLMRVIKERIPKRGWPRAHSGRGSYTSARSERSISHLPAAANAVGATRLA